LKRNDLIRELERAGCELLATAVATTCTEILRTANKHPSPAIAKSVNRFVD
jgi:hypothetical protein